MIGKWIPLAGLCLVIPVANAERHTDDPYSFQIPAVTSIASSPNPTPPIGTALFDLSDDTMYVWTNGGSWVKTIGEASQTETGIVSTGAQTFGGDKTFAGTVQVSMTTYAGNGNVTALSSSKTFIKTTNTMAWYLDGIDAGVDGQILTVLNSDTYSMTISDLSMSANNGDRIVTNTGADVYTTGRAAVTLLYDSSADSGYGAWLIVSIDD